MNLLSRLNTAGGKIAEGCIRAYQHTISPDQGLPSLWLKGKVCSHEPHCSAYGKECFERYGFWPGFLYTVDRISSCTPKPMTQYDPAHYKVVFFSSAPIGVPFLQQLTQDKRFEVVGVVCAPDKPVGRGLEVKSNIIKETALQLKTNEELGGILRNVEEDNLKTKDSMVPSPSDKGAVGRGQGGGEIEVTRDSGLDNSDNNGALSTEHGALEIMTPNKINPEKSDEGKAFTEWLKSKDADFFVVIAYGKIMPQSILEIPKLGPINFHGSLLPKYRGASPIQSALLHNDTMTGITIMYMNEKMDEGDEIAKLGFSIDFSRTTDDIIHKMIQIGPEFLCNTLWDFGKQHLTRRPQDHSKATYAVKFTKEDGKVDPWKDSLQTIYNKYRAFYQRPKIYFIYNEKRVIIEKVVVDHTPDMSGEIPMVNENNELHSSIVECLVKPEGKKTMSWDDFRRGYLLGS